MAFAAVVVAAGRSLRFGGVKKEYRLLDGRPVLAHSLVLLLDMSDCLAAVAVVPPGGEAEARAALGTGFVAAVGDRLRFAEGGSERRDSVRSGLAALADLDPPVVLVHDAARPRADAALVRRVLDGIGRCGACVPAVPVTDTVKRVGPDGIITGHLARGELRAVQTPQGFRYRELVRAYEAAGSREATDDAETWALAGGAVSVVEGDRLNTKITYPEDLP